MAIEKKNIHSGHDSNKEKEKKNGLIMQKKQHFCVCLMSSLLSAALLLFIVENVLTTQTPIFSSCDNYRLTNAYLLIL